MSRAASPRLRLRSLKQRRMMARVPGRDEALAAPEGPAAVPSLPCSISWGGPHGGDRMSQVPTRACGKGSRQISLRPEWSNRCDRSGSIYSESEIGNSFPFVFSPCEFLSAVSPLEQLRILGYLGKVPEAATPTSDQPACHSLS